MNGAIIEPCATTSSAPKITMTNMMGASHSFLRDLRKAHNSLTKFIVALVLIFESVTTRPWRCSLDPVRAAIYSPQAQFVSAK